MGGAQPGGRTSTGAEYPPGGYDITFYLCASEAPFQDVWKDYKEITETPEHLVPLENLIFLFLRGHTDPNQYQRMTKVTWYSDGGRSDTPGMPIAEWWGDRS